MTYLYLWILDTANALCVHRQLTDLAQQLSHSAFRQRDKRSSILKSKLFPSLLPRSRWILGLAGVDPGSLEKMRRRRNLGVRSPPCLQQEISVADCRPSGLLLVDFVYFLSDYSPFTEVSPSLAARRTRLHASDSFPCISELISDYDMLLTDFH